MPERLHLIMTMGEKGSLKVIPPSPLSVAEATFRGRVRQVQVAKATIDYRKWLASLG